MRESLETRSIELHDGRRLADLDGGDPAGYPVIGLHGTPGCRLSRWPNDAEYRSAGVRYITTDRAGYGQSSRHRGRQVADEAADILAVADALELPRFAVVGGSGGGPHALACAALLAHRVERVVCQSGLAPLGADGLTQPEWLRGMSDECVDELRWAQAGEETLVHELTIEQQEMESRLAGDPSRVLGEGALTPDRDYMQRPEVVQAFGRIVVEQAARGVFGAVDDHLAFARPWGFAVSSIAVPVLLTYGLRDVFVPAAHGEWLASRLGRVDVRVAIDGGHMPTDPVGEIAETMGWIRNGS